jgi:hypothetical protein
MLVTLRVTRFFSERISNKKKMDYPIYYKKDGLCIKRETDTTGIRVEVPGPGEKLPLIHAPFVTPTHIRFDDVVKDMEPCNQDVYESYLAAFFQKAEANRQVYNDVRQARFDGQQSAR